MVDATLLWPLAVAALVLGMLWGEWTGAERLERTLARECTVAERVVLSGETFECWRHP